MSIFNEAPALQCTSMHHFSWLSITSPSGGPAATSLNKINHANVNFCCTWRNYEKEAAIRRWDKTLSSSLHPSK